MKTGRNEPCHCGSGRKYKHCCLAKDEARASLNRKRARIAHDADVRLLKFAAQLHGRGGLDAAWEDLQSMLAAGSDLAAEDVIEVLGPWYLYDWTPDPARSALPPSRRHPMPVAAALLADATMKLPTDIREYIAACLDSAFSFHEVVEAGPGDRLRLRDVLLGTEATLGDSGLDVPPDLHDLLFGRLVTLGGETQFADDTVDVFDPIAKVDIVPLRNRLRASAGTLDTAALRAMHRDVVGTWLALIDDVLDPVPPDIHNTDGDPYAFHVLTFAIPSAQAAFDALGDLALDRDAVLAGSDVRRDAEGRLTCIEWPWLAPAAAEPGRAHDTVLAHFIAEDDELVVEVNSARRAEAARAMVEERMGDAARHIDTSLMDPEADLEPGDDEYSDFDEIDDDAPLLPEDAAEIREAVGHLVATHYATWPDIPVPALGGRTPLEAVQDPDGRELVEALLVGIERNLARSYPWMDESPAKAVRERLGL